jgi:hypothetical protein
MERTSREVITLTPDQLRYSGKSWNGHYDGWIVSANGLRSITIDDDHYETNELVSLAFKTLVNDAEKKAKPKFRANMVVERDMLSNLEEIIEVDAG